MQRPGSPLPDVPCFAENHTFAGDRHSVRRLVSPRHMFVDTGACLINRRCVCALLHLSGSKRQRKHGKWRPSFSQVRDGTVFHFSPSGSSPTTRSSLSWCLSCAFWRTCILPRHHKSDFRVNWYGPDGWRHSVSRCWGKHAVKASKRCNEALPANKKYFVREYDNIFTVIQRAIPLACHGRKQRHRLYSLEPLWVLGEYISILPPFPFPFQPTRTSHCNMLHA